MGGLGQVRSGGGWASFENRVKLTEVIEGAAGGRGDLQEAWVDEGGEGGRGFVFLHVVTGLALKRDTRVKRVSAALTALQTAGRSKKNNASRRTEDSLLLCMQRTLRMVK